MKKQKIGNIIGLVITLLLIIFIIVTIILSLTASAVHPFVEGYIPSNEWSVDDDYTLILKSNKVVCIDNNYTICLEKEAGKDFVVLNLTDVQIGLVEAGLNTSQEELAEKTIDYLIKTVQPDLITLTGDQTYGERYVIDTIAAMLEKYNIPWAPVFGNHDNQENDSDTAYQASMYESYSNCLFKSGPTNLATVSSGSVAYGNYIVNIVEKEATNPNGFYVVRSLIFMNSRNNQDYTEWEKQQLAEMGLEYNEENLKKLNRVNPWNYAALTDTQIDWYKWAVNGVQKYGKNNQVKSTLSMHIPIYAYNVAFAEAFNGDIDIYDYENNIEECSKITVDQTQNYDTSMWKSGYKTSTGVKHELGGTSPYDDHVLDAILDTDDNPETDFISTDLLVAGHDHINNYIVTYKGVTFAYGLKTGKGCYWEDDMSGGTVISINDDGNFSINHKYYSVFVPLLPIWLIVCICVACVALIIIICLAIKKHKQHKLKALQ